MLNHTEPFQWIIQVNQPVRRRNKGCGGCLQGNKEKRLGERVRHVDKLWNTTHNNKSVIQWRAFEVTWLQAGGHSAVLHLLQTISTPSSPSLPQHVYNSINCHTVVLHARNTYANSSLLFFLPHLTSLSFWLTNPYWIYSFWQFFIFYFILNMYFTLTNFLLFLTLFTMLRSGSLWSSYFGGYF